MGIGQQGENEPPKFPLFDPNGGRGLGLFSTGADFWLSRQHVAGRGPVPEAAAWGFSLSLRQAQPVSALKQNDAMEARISKRKIPTLRGGKGGGKNTGRAMRGNFMRCSDGLATGRPRKSTEIQCWSSQRGVATGQCIEDVQLDDALVLNFGCRESWESCPGYQSHSITEM